MQLSELKKRVASTSRAPRFVGDEGLVIDGRSTMKPVDCVDHKLQDLLAVERNVSAQLRAIPR